MEGNLLFLAQDPMESTGSVEKRIEGENNEVKRTEEVVLPSSEEDGEDKVKPLLRWSIKNGQAMAFSLLRTEEVVLPSNSEVLGAGEGKPWLFLF